MKQMDSMLKQSEKFEFPTGKQIDDELYLKFINFKHNRVNSDLK